MLHLAFLLAASQAAGPHGPRPDYLRDMHRYFDGEVRGAQLFVTAGGLWGASAIAFAAADSDELRGASIPVATVALAELGIGILVWWRTADQVAGLTQSFKDDPVALRAAEAARLEGVNGFMRLVKIAELALIGVGLGLAISGGSLDEPVLTGVGLGLLGQATTMLTLDMFAADRALEYEQAVLRLPQR